MEVSVIYNSDAAGWPNYLQDRISDADTVSADTFLQSDTGLFESMDHRAETRILQSKCVLVIMTPGHIEYLENNRSVSYERYVKTGNKGLMLFLGIEQKELEKEYPNVCAQFPDYKKWSKVNFSGDNVKELMTKIVEIMDLPESITSNFTCVPTTLHCEETTTVVVMIDEPIPEDSLVTAIVKGAFIDWTLDCTRINAHTYTLLMPRSEQTEAKIFIDVDGSSLGHHIDIQYKSFVQTDIVVAINELYCHCLDVLVGYLIKTHKVASDQVDDKLSEVFDYTVDLPVAGYEKLFGIYQYFTDEHSRVDVSSIVHLAAKHDLKELLARLQDLPHFLKVCSITNKQNQRPMEIAKNRNHNILAAYLQDFEEQMEMYMEVTYTKGQGAGYYNNPRPIQPTDQQGDGHKMYVYADHEPPRRHTTTKSIVQPRADFPSDPSENYMDMGGKAGKTLSESDQDSYDEVSEWKDDDSDDYDSPFDAMDETIVDASGYLKMEDIRLEAKKQRPTLSHSTSVPGISSERRQSGKLTKTNTDPDDLCSTEGHTAAPPVSSKHARGPVMPSRPTGPPSHTAAPPIMSTTQQDFISIIKQVRDGQMPIDSAEKILKQWQQNQQTGDAKSFKAKQDLVKKTREELNKVQKSSGLLGGLFNRGKTKKKPEHIHTSAPTVVKTQPIKKASSEEENPYMTRDPPAPPVPSRQISPRVPPATTKPGLLYAGQRVPPATTKPGQPPARSDDIYYADHSEQPSYLEVLGKTMSEDGENYDYVENDDWLENPVARHRPAVPEDDMYIDRDRASPSPHLTSNRHSNNSRASTGSSGRGSTASTVSQSSGIEVSITRAGRYLAEDPLNEDDIQAPYSNVLVEGGQMTILRKTFNRSCDSGLDQIAEYPDNSMENPSLPEAHAKPKRRDDFNAELKRRSISQKEYPAAPPIPSRGARRTPPCSPGPPDDCITSSIPLETPPPIPGVTPPQLGRVEEEKEDPPDQQPPEPSPEERKAAFLAKIGAKAMFGPTHDTAGAKPMFSPSQIIAQKNNQRDSGAPQVAAKPRPPKTSEKPKTAPKNLPAKKW